MNKIFIKQFFKWLHRLYHIAHGKYVTVFIGHVGTNLVLCSENKIEDKLFIASKNQNKIENYKSFLTKYRHYPVFFLLDNIECKLRHELIPTLQSLVKINPVEQFISEHYHHEDIVAYNVHNISNKSTETWDSVLASTPLVSKITNVLEYVFTKSLKFSGIYFLSLEFQSIIDQCLHNSNNQKFDNHLQIFASITEVSGIKVIIKHHKNIIAIKNPEYPYDKSDLYLQGVIEQEINECLISSKEYIKSKNLKVCIIFFVNKKLQQMLQDTSFENHDVLVIPNAIDTKTHKHYVDSAVINFFTKGRRYLASNEKMRSITRLNLLNIFIFKPLILVVIALLLHLGNIKLEAFNINKQASNTNDKYHHIAQEYRAIQQQYPQIQSITNLADLYNFELLLNVYVDLPFKSLYIILNTINQNINIKNIKWKVDVIENMFNENQPVYLEITAEFASNTNSISDAMIDLDQYIDNLKMQLHHSQITYKTDINIARILSNRTIMPILISIIQ